MEKYGLKDNYLKAFLWRLELVFVGQGNEGRFKWEPELGQTLSKDLRGGSCGNER